MTFWGMDPDEVRRVAVALKGQADALGRISSQVDVLVQQSTQVWPGPDSDAFRQTWMTTHRIAFASAVGETTSMAAWLQGQVAEQTQASGGGPAGPTGSHGRVAPFVPHGLREHIRAVTLLDLSQAAYASNGDVGPWHRLTSDELRAIGIDPADLSDPGCGFQASIFRNDAGQIVVSYAGTDPSSVGDIGADASGDVWLSVQSERAVALSLEVKGAVGSDNVVFTGHSLGGRLAALSSVATGAHATTFNAAGMSSTELAYAATAGGANPNAAQWVASNVLGFNRDAQTAMLGVDTSRIDNYSAVADPLSLVQEGVVIVLPDAIGNQHIVATPFELNPLDYHGLDAMRGAVDKADLRGGASGGW